MVDHHPGFESRWCTVETSVSSDWSFVLDLVRTDLCTLADDAVLFGGVYGRFTHSRLLMAHFLATRFPDNSFVIFQPEQDWVEFEMMPAGDIFQDAIEWAASNRQKHDKLEQGFNGCVGSSECLPVYHEIFSKYRVEVVIETNILSQGWITEKTSKCLVAGKPFLLYGTAGQLQQLRKMGFKTFADHIDESYDTIEDPELRFDAICNIATYIHDCAHRDTLLQEMDTVAQWNRQHYRKIVKDYYRDFNN
jgi:hypothetical protein